MKTIKKILIVKANIPTTKVLEFQKAGFEVVFKMNRNQKQIKKGASKQ